MSGSETAISSVEGTDGTDSSVHDIDNVLLRKKQTPRAPRKKKLSDLNVAVKVPKSPKKKGSTKGASKRGSTGRSPKSVTSSMEGIGSMLTALCASGSEHLHALHTADSLQKGPLTYARGDGVTDPDAVICSVSWGPEQGSQSSTAFDPSQTFKNGSAEV